MITLTIFELGCICGGCLGIGALAGMVGLDLWFKRQLNQAKEIVFNGME